MTLGRRCAPLAVLVLGLSARAAAAPGAEAEDEPAAGPPVDVAVLAPIGDDRVLVDAAARARLELGASGFTSALVDTTDGDAYPARLAFVREDGVATIDLLGHLADGSPLNRRVSVPSERGGDDPDVLGLRAAELLRGMRLATRAPARPPALAVVQATDEAPIRSRPAVRIDVRLAGLESRLSGAASGSVPGLFVELSRPVADHVALTASAGAAFVRNLPPTLAGSAHTSEQLFLLGGRVETRRPWTNVSLTLGAGLHHVTATTDSRGAVMPVGAATQDHSSPCVAASVGLSQRLWHNVGAAAALTVLGLLPPVEVYSGTDTIRLGGPSVLESFGMWAELP